MSSCPVHPRFEPLVARAYAALQALGDAFKAGNPAVMALDEALQNDELLNCGDIGTEYNNHLCSTWSGFCNYYELTVDQADRFRELLTPLSGIVTCAIDFDGYHMILGQFVAPGDDGKTCLMQVDYLMADNPFQRKWALFALFLARHPDYPIPAFMIVD